MKKLILALALTLSFCTHGMAVKPYAVADSNGPFKRKIRDLKLNCSNLNHNIQSIQKEIENTSKKRVELKSKLRTLVSNPEVNSSVYFKTKMKKLDAHFNITTLLSRQIDLLVSITKIYSEIDKINSIIIITEMLAYEKDKKPY
jgi:hypothetical protein